MATNLRYCQECEGSFPHDKVSADKRERGTPGVQFVIDVMSLGMLRLTREYVWKCQRCGIETRVC